MHLAIPDGLGSITPEWLTEALALGGASSAATVTSIRMERVGEEQGWTGEVARCELSYSHLVEGAPASLIVKFSPRDPDPVFGLREARFYQEIAAGRDLPVPLCYYGQIDPRNGANVLLLEDLSRFRTVNFVDGCTPAEAAVAVAGLASIHAAWWGDDSLESKDWLFTIADTDFADWWGQYPRSIKTILPEIEVSRGLMEFGDRFVAEMPLMLDRIEGAPFTFIHRDAHIDNILFGSDPADRPAVLVDWQTAGRGRGVSDVAYLLISSLRPPDRRRSERRLVATYHRHLIELGVAGYTLDECWTDYLIGAASKLLITVTATVLLDNTSPHRRAWRRSDLERLTAFIEDHDPISYL